ncbi:MAG TPA: hypothetical protein VJZ32_02940 [Candidatus Bathyarchaeia archaeon]|nr:hypothetical protein [Candidatus Bathyarchaeia archaeon]
MVSLVLPKSLQRHMAIAQRQHLSLVRQLRKVRQRRLRVAAVGKGNGKVGSKDLILVVALINAVFHAILVQFIVYSVSNGLYFLVTAILFAVGGFAALSSGKLFKPAILGLFVLSLIDNILIFITASFATPLSGGQVYGWATDLNPPGQVPVFLIQILLMILTAYVLLSKRKTS